MELNAEQIKSDLEHCKFGKDKPICEGCNYKPWIKPICFGLLCSNALALITSQEQRIEELTEENEKLTINMNAFGLTAKRLSEENERLRGILLEFTDIVHKWGNKYGYDTSEISLVPILNEETAIKAQIKADTVRKYREQLHRAFAHSDSKDKFNKGVFLGMVDLIAKEMLEGKDEIRD